VLFGALGAAASAATPQLTAAAFAKFSPDGDTVQDSVTWKVSADAATSFLRVRVTRSGKTVWARLAPVAQAGEFTFVWDGSDETGRIVRNGAYGYAIEAVNRSGVASAALRGYVEVDSAVRSISLRRPQ
jgi:flagellar hook assembly protein FlgD